MSTTITSSRIPLQRGTFHLAIWGCQMNVYDAARLKDLLHRDNWREVADPGEASLIVLITCAVREKAEDKVFNQIAAWRHQGLIGDHTIVALGGCVGSELGAEIVHRNPLVQIVFGPRSTHRLPDLIRDWERTHTPVVDLGADDLEKFSHLPIEQQPGYSAFVTIMEGCSNHCSYCIVPTTRGEEISRPVEEILCECQALLKSGALEIHLLGQNVNSYAGNNASGAEYNFPDLLYEVAALPGLRRLRFTTSNPMDFSPDLVRSFADLKVVASHVHVPVQSGSDRILELMNRRYTRAQYLELTAALREARPGILLSSDFIVGFPGESDEDFADTIDLVDKVSFDESFSFIYSPRPGTPAAALPDPIPRAEKELRLHVLQEHLERSTLSHNAAFIGTETEVIIEGRSRKDPNELRGRTPHNRLVIFSGDPSRIGTMARVRINEAVIHTLRGELIS